MGQKLCESDNSCSATVNNAKRSTFTPHFFAGVDRLVKRRCYETLTLLLFCIGYIRRYSRIPAHFIVYGYSLHLRWHFLDNRTNGGTQYCLSLTECTGYWIVSGSGFGVAAVRARDQTNTHSGLEGLVLIFTGRGGI
jgi:hypothetical protein